MNLQICFMNESPSDSESAAGSEAGRATSPGQRSTADGAAAPGCAKQQRPRMLEIPPPTRHGQGQGQALVGREVAQPLDEADAFARQGRLRMEARLALAQAKEMAHLHMQLERQKTKQLPITRMVAASLRKVSCCSLSALALIVLL